MARKSGKSRSVALILGVTLGVFGAHRFYAGKFGTGVLMLLTAGGLGIWYLIDLISIASGEFRDGDGLKISNWDPNDGSNDIPQEILDEIYNLRTEVNELQERVDFTERLLAEKQQTKQIQPP